jgi:predicted ATPase
MMRELIQALAALATQRPIVLIIEDLHWVDASSLDLLNALVRRNQRTRLFVIGSHRRLSDLGSDHPLKRLLPEWEVHGLSATVPLSGLSATDIERYLDQRFPAHTFPPRFAHLLFERTEGNPLFVGNMLIAGCICLRLRVGWVSCWHIPRHYGFGW